jgi:hypothetical protein
MNAVELGREMMDASGTLNDDRQCCDWARVGQILTQLGAPMMPATVNDLNPKDRQVVVDALRMLQSKS